MRLKDWLNEVGDRLKPTTYVEFRDIPDEPAGPYRARVSAALDLGPEGVEVCEREIVRGEMQMVYAIRCPCGRRWFDTAPERLQVCPKCGKAVLLQPMD
jgi:DNA-directed RNA polymerase subunit RPC12/RpoP